MDMDLDEVRAWSLERLWNFIKKEKDVPRGVYNKIRFGEIDMDINSIFNKEFTTYNTKGFIKFRGRKISKQELYTDLEERERIAFQWIAENFPNREVVRRRDVIGD